MILTTQKGDDMIRIRSSVVVVVVAAWSTAGAYAQLCPNPIPNGTFCVTPVNSPFVVPAGWKAASIIIMEDGTTMRFDPLTKPDWRVDMGTLIVGQNVVFDLSGRDAVGQAGPGQNGDPGPREGNGHAGYNGGFGVKGEDSAGLELHVQNVQIGGLTILRKAGRGQLGGNGGVGGEGGGATCQHNAGDGGVGGAGGKGGPGGDVHAVQIFYGNLSIRPDVSRALDKAKANNDWQALRTITAAIGINDQPTQGQGGGPGTSGHGGGQEGGTCGCAAVTFPLTYCTGGGVDRSQEVPQSFGKGSDGAVGQFSMQSDKGRKPAAAAVDQTVDSITVNFVRPGTPAGR